MKVFISVDIEGITGLVSWSQCGGPNSTTYDFQFARERMTDDVNAAIRGAKAAGAKEIVLRDSHGNSKNLLVDRLEPGARMVSGHGAGTDGMMIGVDSSFDAAMLIGYHAKAGTGGGIMEHTISGKVVHRLKINGEDVGEIGLSAGVAATYGVPIVCISSDQAGCDEAAALLLGVATAVVKTGIGRYSGLCLEPCESLPIIEAAAKDGCLRAKSLKTWLPKLPGTVELECNRSEEADQAARLIGVRRVDGYTVAYDADTYQELHQAAWAMISAAGVGSNNGN